MWCGIGGVLSSMLQFAFVLGSDMTDVATARGLSETKRAMPIWLICFCCNAVGHVAYACWMLTANATWAAFRNTSSQDTLHAVFLCLCMASFVTFHILSYGAAAAFMGDAGAAFAWPLVMSSTVCTAQGWSVILREWVGAPHQAVRANLQSIAMLVCAVVVVSVSGIG